MRAVILLSLLYIVVSGFELAKTQIDRDTTQFSLYTTNLAPKLSPTYLNIQTFKILNSHYNLNYEENHGLNNIDLLDIKSLKFNHWAVKNFSFNIFQTINKNIKDYNLYGIYSASHNLNLNIFTITNSIHTTYDETLEERSICTHSSDINAQILKNTKIGTTIYQDENKEYNANYYINTQIYKNLYLDLLLEDTQDTNNFYTKFKITY